jgi:hypothetical protein
MYSRNLGSLVYLLSKIWYGKSAETATTTYSWSVNSLLLAITGQQQKTCYVRQIFASFGRFIVKFPQKYTMSSSGQKTQRFCVHFFVYSNGRVN